MWKRAPALLLLILLSSNNMWADTRRSFVENLPPDALPLSENYYNGQVVINRQGDELGDVNDVVLDKEGRVLAVIIGVGGVLGAGEKNVAVSFDALEIREDEGSHYLVLDVKKASLEAAPGLDFDQGKRRWMPAAARVLEQQLDGARP